DAWALGSCGAAGSNPPPPRAGINTARYAVRLGLPMPILFVCEDNETGISVPTPDGWIASSFSHLEHLRYDLADGEIDEVWDTVAEAIRFVRGARRPAFLTLRQCRRWGHR